MDLEGAKPSYLFLKGIKATQGNQVYKNESVATPFNFLKTVCVLSVPP